MMELALPPMVKRGSVGGWTIAAMLVTRELDLRTDSDERSAIAVSGCLDSESPPGALRVIDSSGIAALSKKGIAMVTSSLGFDFSISLVCLASPDFFSATLRGEP
jgi:hypothetical protein